MLPRESPCWTCSAAVPRFDLIGTGPGRVASALCLRVVVSVRVPCVVFLFCVFVCGVRRIYLAAVVDISSNSAFVVVCGSPAAVFHGYHGPRPLDIRVVPCVNNRVSLHLFCVLRVCLLFVFVRVLSQVFRRRDFRSSRGISLILGPHIWIHAHQFCTHGVRPENRNPATAFVCVCVCVGRRGDVAAWLLLLLLLHCAIYADGGRRWNSRLRARCRATMSTELF